MCEVCRGKDDPNITQIIGAGGDIYYPGYVATSVGLLELVTLMINSMIPRLGALFDLFDVRNFCLDTPLESPEYVRVRLQDIPQEFIDYYNMFGYERIGWIYFKIISRCVGLKHSVKLANELLCTRLDKAGYYEASTTPGLWKHKWRY